MDKYIAVVGFVQSLFGILIFSTKRPKHLSFHLLTVWMVFIAIFLGARLLPFEVVEYFKPGIFPFMFLTGPLLYFYVRSLTVENFQLKPIHLIHSIPFLLVSLHRSTINVVPIASPSDLAENPSYLYNKIYYSFLIISVFAYWFWGLKLIFKHRKNIPLYFSNYSGKNTLNWLIFVLTLFLVLFIANFSAFFVQNVLELAIIRFTSLSFNLTVFTFIMIYFGINQSVIYEKEKRRPFIQQQISHSNVSEINKYAGSALNEEQVFELTETVINYLRNNKPYLNPEYSLQMMVDDLNIPRHKLSQVINRSQNKNFYKFINELRIEEVKEMLVNRAYKHYSVLGIAVECGFNSKTSFNRIFKEETGFTPTEYKRNIFNQKGSNSSVDTPQKNK